MYRSVARVESEPRANEKLVSLMVKPTPVLKLVLKDLENTIILFLNLGHDDKINNYTEQESLMKEPKPSKRPKVEHYIGNIKNT